MFTDKLLHLLLLLCFLHGHKAQHTSLSDCPKQLPRDRYLVGFRNSCLRFVNHETDWTGARDNCRANGGGLLVQILDAETQKFVVDNLHKLGWRHNGVWIGASDNHKEGVWLWVTGQPVRYGNWRAGYGPRHTGVLSTKYIDDCAQIRLNHGGRWMDYVCSGGPAFYYTYICQYDLKQTPPTVKTTEGVVITAEGVVITTPHTAVTSDGGLKDITNSTTALKLAPSSGTLSTQKVTKLPNYTNISSTSSSASYSITVHSVSEHLISTKQNHGSTTPPNVQSSAPYVSSETPKIETTGQQSDNPSTLFKFVKTTTHLTRETGQQNDHKSTTGNLELNTVTTGHNDGHNEPHSTVGLHTSGSKRVVLEETSTVYVTEPPLDRSKSFPTVPKQTHQPLNRLTSPPLSEYSLTPQLHVTKDRTGHGLLHQTSTSSTPSKGTAHTATQSSEESPGNGQEENITKAVSDKDVWEKDSGGSYDGKKLMLIIGVIGGTVLVTAFGLMFFLIKRRLKSPLLKKNNKDERKEEITFENALYGVIVPGEQDV